MIKNNLSDLEKNEEKEITIGIDLGTTYSCAGIYRDNNVEIIPDDRTGNKILPSIVCFKSETQCLIGISAKRNKSQYPESTMFDSKRLIGRQFINKNIQKDIKNWPVKVIEDKKTGKLKYVIKIGKEEKESYKLMKLFGFLLIIVYFLFSFRFI